MFGQNQLLNNYLNALLQKGFYTTFNSEYIKLEGIASICTMTNMQRLVVRIRNTVNFYYEDNEVTPFVGGVFDTLIELLYDRDGSIYEVREDCYYNPETIQLHQEDVDFCTLAAEKSQAKTDLFYDMVNNLLHGTPFHMIVLKNDAYQLMSWDVYCNELPLIEATLKKQVINYLNNFAQQEVQALLRPKLISSTDQGDNIYSVHIQNTLSLQSSPNCPIVQGQFETVLQVILDEDGKIYNVNIVDKVCNYGIAVIHQDAGFSDLAQQFAESPASLFNHIVLQLMQGSRVKVLMQSGRQQYGVNWNNYVEYAPVQEYIQS